MSKFKHFYEKYHIDRALGATWIMLLLIEYSLVKSHSTETIWLPLIAICLWLICTIRAAKIRKEKKRIPMWYIAASVPGTLASLSWIEYSFRSEIMDMMSRGLALEGPLAIVVRIATTLPFAGFILSSIWLMLLAYRVFEFFFEDFIEEKNCFDN